jgi:hypothetical protein
VEGYQIAHSSAGKMLKKQIQMLGKNKQNRIGRVAQVIQHLPSKPETLSSNPITNKKREKRIKGTEVPGNNNSTVVVSSVHR